jgi:hypothetical protein
MYYSRRGQSLIEIMIAVAVGAVLVGGAVMLVSVVLKSGEQNKYFQGASLLSKDLMDKVTVYIESDWYCVPLDPTHCGIYNLIKDPVAANKYYLSTTTVQFSWTQGADSTGIEHSISAAGLKFERYFIVQNVCRDNTTGDITGITDNSGASTLCSGGPNQSEDPSTQQVTVTTFWTQNGQNRNVSLIKHFTRNKNMIFRQTDWSGGAGQAGPLDVPNSRYFSDDGNIDASTTGQIKIR